MNEVWFLSGGSAVRYDIALDAADGIAVPVTQLWSGLEAVGMADGWDAALNYGDGKAYFFKADGYVRVDIATATVETELRSIAAFWTGMADAGFGDGIQAAVNYGNGTVYFFKGDLVVAYDVAQDAVLSSPGTIAAWGIPFTADLDAVVNYGNGKLYFFQGDQYARYDTVLATADGGPSSIAEFWPGLADAGVASGVRGAWSTADPAGTGGATSGATTAGGAAGDRNALRNGADVEAYFTARTGQGFIDWFNANHAGKGQWAQRRMSVDADTRARFVTFWDTIPVVFGQSTITLEQFVALQSIVLNELGGSMKPVSEMTGSAGLAYLFNAIPGKKASYNTGSASRSALVCFNDPGFVSAHGSLAFGSDLANTTDQVWAGTAYPQDRYPVEMTAAGMIAEADFCKFRGRGMIQTTWRSGYLPIISFVQSYSGPNATVAGYQARWVGQDRDAVAYASSNADWDDLYQRSDYVIPAAAIRLHSQSAGGYLAISPDPAVRAGSDIGSFQAMGKRISGSGTYATLFAGRCQQILDTLN